MVAVISRYLQLGKNTKSRVDRRGWSPEVRTIFQVCPKISMSVLLIVAMFLTERKKPVFQEGFKGEHTFGYGCRVVLGCVLS